MKTDYGTYVRKQRARRLETFSNQLLQEKFREENLYLRDSLLSVFGASAVFRRVICGGLFLLSFTPLTFIARDIKRLRLTPGI